MKSEEDGRKDNGGDAIELHVDDIIEDQTGSIRLIISVVQVLLLLIARVFDSQIMLVTVFSDAQPSWKCTVCPSGHDASSSTGMCGLKDGDWEWVGGDKSSIISEWGLVCDRKFRAGLPASMFFIGCAIGSAALGRRLENSFSGKKKAVFITCLMTSITAFMTSLSPNIWVYAAFRFLCGFSRAGVAICSHVLYTETVGRKWSHQVGQCCNFFYYIMGFVSLVFLAYPTRNNWRKLYRILSLPPLFYSLLVLPFLFESPRSREKEDLQIFKNLVKLPSNVIIRPSSENIWTTRRMVLIIMITAFGVGLVYYGIQLNGENLNFNFYLTVFRKAIMLFSSMAFVSVIACVASARRFKEANGEKDRWSQMASEAVGFMAVSMAHNVLYIYCVELFPTNVRNFAVSMLLLLTSAYLEDHQPIRN